MSTVSKILVVVILVLVAGSTFLQVALFAQKANWRKLYDNAQTVSVRDVAKLQEEKKAIQEQKVQAEQQFANVAAENRNLKNEIETLNQNVAEFRTKSEQLEEQKARKEEDLNALNEKVASMMEQIAQLQEKMRRDAQELLEVKREYERLVNSVTALRDRNNSLMMTLNNTRIELEGALGENEKLTLALRKYAAKSGTEITVDKVQMTIRAHVLAANNEAGVLLISVGKDDKVELGMEFIVHRGSDYICKGRVESIYPDTCVVRIIDKSLVSTDAEVMVGDNAFTE